MGSIDREKVIKGLACCIEKLNIIVNPTYGCNCIVCPYYQQCETIHALVGLPLAKDALALLKAQEPRVMTLEEAKNAFVIEYRSGKLKEAGRTILNIDLDPTNANYGVIYRVWTSRPTKAKQEVTPWES